MGHKPNPDNSQVVLHESEVVISEKSQTFGQVPDLRVDPAGPPDRGRARRDDGPHQQDRASPGDGQAHADLGLDLVTGAIHRATPDSPNGPAHPLIIPANAVVVPGSRSLKSGKGAEWGLSIATPIIIKYRDDKTELSLVLEDLLR